MRSRLILLAAATLVVSSCQWTHPRFGPGATGVNASESTLGAAQLPDVAEAWTTGGTPVALDGLVAANGSVFTGTSTGHLGAFPANGATCASDPACPPRWRSTSPLQSDPGGAIRNGDTPYLAAEGRLHAPVVHAGEGATRVAGYALGGCASAQCAPVWQTTALGTVFDMTSIGSTLFVSQKVGTEQPDPLYPPIDVRHTAAFDLSGERNCSGAGPVTCGPLWSIAHGGPLAAGGSTLVIGPGISRPGPVRAYDAAGETNCTGEPVVCAPLWSSAVDVAAGMRIAVSGDRVWTRRSALVEAYDLAGITGCSGSPTVCTHIWSGGNQNVLHPFATDMAVSDDAVYLPVERRVNNQWRTAITLIPTTGSSCFVTSGVPHCNHTALYDHVTSPTVANGLLWAEGTSVPGLHAFDAAAQTGCSGLPRTCQPLRTFDGGRGWSQGDIVVANGQVFEQTGPLTVPVGAPPPTAVLTAYSIEP